jgi:hypothetical protein
MEPSSSLASARRNDRGSDLSTQNLIGSYQPDARLLGANHARMAASELGEEQHELLVAGHETHHQSASQPHMSAAMRPALMHETDDAALNGVDFFGRRFMDQRGTELSNAAQSRGSSTNEEDDEEEEDEEEEDDEDEDENAEPEQQVIICHRYSLQKI